jgi:hypothetical protein
MRSSFAPLWAALALVVGTAACSPPGPAGKLPPASRAPACLAKGPAKGVPDSSAYEALLDAYLAAVRADIPSGSWYKVVHALLGATPKWSRLSNAEADSFLTRVLDGRGPRRLSEAGMEALRRRILEANLASWGLMWGVQEGDDVDYNGDRLPDLDFMACGRHTCHGALYLRTPRGYLRAGVLDGRLFAVCPRGGGAADIYEDNSDHYQTVVTRSRVSLAGIRRLTRDERHYEERWDRTADSARYRRLTRVPRGCFKPCDFTPERCYDASEQAVAGDTARFDLAARSDSLHVQLQLVPSSWHRGEADTLRWALLDPQGRTRWEGLVPVVRRVDERARVGPALRGTWMLVVKGGTGWDWFGYTVGSWNDPGVRR